MLAGTLGRLGWQVGRKDLVEWSFTVVAFTRYVNPALFWNSQSMYLIGLRVNESESEMEIRYVF